MKYLFFSKKEMKALFLKLFMLSLVFFVPNRSFAKNINASSNVQNANLVASTNTTTSQDATVVLNTKTKKYHKSGCRFADSKKCNHCTKMTKSEAIKHGGKPCKLCNKDLQKKK